MLNSISGWCEDLKLSKYMGEVFKNSLNECYKDLFPEQEQISSTAT
jgi:hypothetical protein